MTKDTKQQGGVGARMLWRLLGYIMYHWHLALIALALSLCSNYLALRGPIYLGNAIDAISAEGGVQMDIVLANFFGMLVCYVCSAVLAYLLTLVMVNLSQKITYRMRKQLFETLTTLPVSYFDSHPTGDIVSRISYDIDTVNSTLSTDLVQVLSSVYTVFGSLYFMLTISPPLILVFAITVPISILFTRRKAKRSSRCSAREAKSSASSTALRRKCSRAPKRSAHTTAPRK